MFRDAGWDLSQPVPEGWSVDMQLLKEITDRRGTPIVGPPQPTDGLRSAGRYCGSSWLHNVSASQRS